MNFYSHTAKVTILHIFQVLLNFRFSSSEVTVTEEAFCEELDVCNEGDICLSQDGL